MKNIVLCCDGTANEFAQHRTNVVKLYYALARDPAQVAYYHPGVGTIEAVGAISTAARKMTKLMGLAFGYGLETDIRDAYVYLMTDRIFLFGFSRGAYTVRALGSLLHMYGLIPAGNEPFVPYAIRMLTAIQKRNPDEVFELAREFRDTFSTRNCQPYFIGVWDTVSSVGWIENPSSCHSQPAIPISRLVDTRSQSTSAVPFFGRIFGIPPRRHPLSRPEAALVT